MALWRITWKNPDPIHFPTLLPYLVYIITCRGMTNSVPVECSRPSPNGVLKIDETPKTGSAQMKHVSGYVSAPSGERFSPLIVCFTSKYGLLMF